MPSMLPTEPNTPPFSTVWKVVHFPLVLLVIGLAFMVAAGALSGLVSGVLAGLGADESGPMAVGFGPVVAALFTSAYLACVWLVAPRRQPAFGLPGWGRKPRMGLPMGGYVFPQQAPPGQSAGKARG